MSSVATLTASLEDYLEAIYRVVEEKQAARPKDIAGRLRVSNASVTGALRSLAGKQLVNYAPFDVVTLTREGRAAAERIVRGHEAIRDFFVRVLAVGEVEAEEAACKLEHVVPAEILNRFIRFVEFVEVCPRSGATWIEAFRAASRHRPTLADCRDCAASCLSDLEDKEETEDGEGRSTVADLDVGQRGRITRITLGGALGKKLADLDAHPGTLIEVEAVDRQEGQIKIKLNGYHLVIGEDAAAGVSVERL